MKKGFQVTFLGTGTSQGIPVLGSQHPVCKSDDPKDKRLRVSVLLQWENHSYVIDCGPDFRYQMLRENVQEVHGVLLTHDHSDHTAGIDDIRPYNFKLGRMMPFFAEQNVFDALNKRFAYVFATENKYPGAPSIEQIVIEADTIFTIGDKQVIPIRAFHATLPVLGFRIEKFTYLTDVKTIEASQIEKLKGTEVLVVNALRKEPHYSHFNIEEALAFIEKVQPKVAYLTHISHVMGFHAEVEKTLPLNVHLAYDGLKIEV